MKLACLLLAAGAVLASDTARIRIFLLGSQPVQLSGDASLGETEGSVQLAGGTAKEHVEVMRNFMKHCPQVIITANRERADYVVRVEHEGANPATLFERANKVAIFNKDEDLIFTHSTRFLSSAVKDACRAFMAPPAVR
jgi:hypothetical protein